MFINPALLAIEDTMEAILLQEIDVLGSFYASMTLLIIGMLLLYDLYLVGYPIRSMEVEIKLTN